MAVREIRIYGDPVLSQVAKPIDKIDDSIRELIRDLLDTTALPGRAGVAAPQIGVSLRAFSYNIDGDIGYVINPEVVETRGEKVDVEEGCLSVPELWLPTPRYEWAKVQGQNLQGGAITLEGDGLMAQMLQHETDHLDGKVYIRRLEGETRKAAMRQIRHSDWF